METVLDPLEARVLACLVEKSMTIPEHYPLTLNALVAACNQKSSRNPTLLLTDKDVLHALDSLRDRKLAWQTMRSGSRTPRYRHSLTDVFALTDAHGAVLCELMLRGPQTAGELRSRASRMVQLPDLSAVQEILQDLTDRPSGSLATTMPSRPGRREVRYAHLLCGPPADTAAPEPCVEPPRPAVPADNRRLEALEGQVASLAEQLSRLGDRLTEFENQFR